MPKSLARDLWISHGLSKNIKQDMQSIQHIKDE
jgi:hypothetical protein